MKEFEESPSNKCLFVIITKSVLKFNGLTLYKCNQNYDVNEWKMLMKHGSRNWRALEQLVRCRKTTIYVNIRPRLGVYRLHVKISIIGNQDNQQARWKW